MTGIKKNSRFKFKNIIIYLLSFLASFVGIFLNFYLARVLSAERYGQIQYLIALATTFSQLIVFGLNSFLIREAKNPAHNGEVVNKCFTIYLIIIVFFFPIIYNYSFNFASVTANNAVLSASITIVAILIGANSLISAFFQGNGKYHLTIIFENLIPKTALLVISIVFTLLGKLLAFENNYLIFYIIIYSAIALPFTLYLFKKINFSVSKQDLLSIFFFFGVTVTYSLGNNLTKVLQGGLYNNNVALAIISVSFNIVSLVRIFTSVLDNMIKPIFAKYKRLNDTQKILDVYRFDTRMNSYIAIPLYLFFIFHAEKFLILFGADYLVYSNILVIISIANFVNDLTGPNGTMLAMTGNERVELFNGFLYFAFYIASVFLFSFDKVYGLSLALLVAQVAVNLAKYIEVWIINKKMPLNYKTIFSILIILAANLVVIYLVRYLQVGLIVWYVISIAIGITLVFANIFALSLYRIKDFKDFLRLEL